MRDRYDVAIVGYGPVGQALAILLGQRGWKVGVFEKQPVAYPLPRTVHFDHEVGRILQAAGIADGLVGMTEAADVYEWRNAAGETLLRFESKTAGTSGWPEANMFAQPDLEQAVAVDHHERFAGQERLRVLCDRRVRAVEVSAYLLHALANASQLGRSRAVSMLHLLKLDESARDSGADGAYPAKLVERTGGRIEPGNFFCTSM